MKPTRIHGTILLVVLTLTCYANTLPNAFVWDDELLVVDNNFIRNGTYIEAAFSTDLFHNYTVGVASHYRPLQTISYMFDYVLWGLRPFGFHLTNVLLHVVCVLLVWRLVETLSGVRWLALLVAALFAVHSVGTNAVAYVSGRADPMAFAFMLSALLLFIEYRARIEQTLLTRAGLYTASMLCFVGALFSRENALLFPLLVAVYCATLGASKHDNWTKAWLAALPYAVVAISFVAWRFAVLEIQGKPARVEWALPLAVRAQLIFRALATYLGLLVWPAHLQMERQLVVGGAWLHVLTALGLCSAVALLIFARWARRSSPVALFGVSWFLITLLPVTGLLSLNASVAEHWLYVPSVGLYLAVAVALRHARACVSVLQGGNTVRLGAAACVVAMVALLARTVRRNRDWESPVALYSQTKHAAPYSGGVRCNLAREYINAGQPEKALAELVAEEQLEPRNALARSNLAAFYFTAGDLGNARRKAEESLQLDPSNTSALLQLAMISEQQGHTGDARRHYVRALATTTDVRPRLQYGTFLLRHNEPKEVLQVVTEAYALEPGNADVFNLLGAVLSENRQYDKAEEAFQMARSLDRHCSNADVNLGRLANLRGDLAAAAASYARALRIQPDDVRALYQFGLIHWRQGELARALEKLNAAQALAPSSVTIREALTKLRRGESYEKATEGLPTAAITAG